MSRRQVVMTAPRLAEPAVRLLEAADCSIHYMPPYPPPDTIAALARTVRADAILTRQGQVTAEVMDASDRLVIVARHGVGVDDVDLAAAAARGIMVTRAPGSNTDAVAEHTVAMVLALAKQFGPLGASIADGAWRGAATKVRDIAGLRLGLLGLGAIGRRVATLAAAFDMEVAAFDPAAPESAFGDAIARAPSLDALLERSDALSVHCPLTPATRRLIGADAIARLPAGAMVVNTARGGIVDETALYDALQSGHLSGAALDVFETEPPPADHPLRRHPAVIVTPHVAGVTDAALIAMGAMAAECIAWRLQGLPVPAERIVTG